MSEDKHCVMCSRELKPDTDFTDPMEEVEGNICHRCFLMRAQQKGSLRLSWSIETVEAEPTFNEVGKMVANLAFAPTELLQQVRKKMEEVADGNPNITEDGKRRVLRVIDAAIEREEE